MTAASPDGSPMESPLDVERVEWVPDTADALEVRLSGRWRGSEPSEPIELLVDDAGERRRFRAVTAGPADGGGWSASFSVPVELRARLGARLGLTAGGRELSLPAASPGPTDEGAAPPAATIVDPQVLAERRARREGMADEALLRRAQAAEATVQTLETQLELLESRLREARAGSDERVAELEQEAADLRRRLEAAEAHAEALGAEMDAIRREAAEDRAAGADAGVQAELDRLRGEAASLTQLLAEERAARGDAEARLVRQGDRVAEVEATVTLLVHELERRASVQTAVQVELEELREALVRVRAQAEAANRADGTRIALEELKATAVGLRERIGGLEAAERAARAELRDARAELEARERELARARADLDRAQADLAAARAAEEGRASALREAERTVAAVRREAAELQGRLDEERRRRFEVEASLKAELERERETFGGYVAEVEGELRARIAAERSAFEAQAASIEALVGELRGRLAAVGAELEERLAGERRLREEAVAARDEALAEAARVKLEVAADLERAASEREELLGRLLELEREIAEARAEGEQRAAAVGAELAARLAETEAERDRLAGELEALRGRASEDAERDATIEALVADVVAMGSKLRESFGRSLEELSARIESEVERLRAELEEERTQRWVVEQELAAERERGLPAAGGLTAAAASLARTELEATRRELAAAQEQLAAERARSADAGEEATRLVADLEAAEARLKERERAEAAEAGAAEAEEAEGEAPEAEAPEAEASEPDAPDAGARDGEVPPAGATPEPAGSALRAELTQPSGAEQLPVRVLPPGQRRPSAWLAPAIARVAQVDEAAAARLLVELLPAQAGLVKHPVAYGLTIQGHGSYRVEAGPRDARAEAATGPAALVDVDARLSGSVAALAPLAAGGAGRRLRDVRVEGRKRRLRKLLRARRAPFDLAQLVERRIELEPALVLGVLAAAVDPRWTSGHRFGVVYAVSGEETLEVLVDSGAPLAVEPADRPRTEAPAATVSLRRSALLPLLTRTAAPSGERALVAGDADAVARLHAWFHRAQGLPAD